MEKEKSLTCLLGLFIVLGIIFIICFFRAIFIITKYQINLEENQIQEKSDDSWKSCYCDFISTYPNNDQYSYTLISINDDSIPELVMVGDCEAVGTMIGVYNNENVELEQLNRTYFTYLPQENVLLDYGGNMGYYLENVYSIQNNKLTVITGGERELKNGNCNGKNENDYRYIWDGKEEDYADYYQMLNSVYDTTREVDGYNYTELYNVNAIVQAIIFY